LFRKKPRVPDICSARNLKGKDPTNLRVKYEFLKAILSVGKLKHIPFTAS